MRILPFLQQYTQPTIYIKQSPIPKIYIGVDHGNRQIKTVNHTFISGLVSSKTVPPGMKDILQYNGTYYSLSHKRLPYRSDKTVDENFFMLTLIAVAQEIFTRKIPGNTFDVALGIGLPPQHYSRQKDAFTRYFSSKGRVEYKYKGRLFRVCFTSVKVYPQAYAAILPRFSEVCNISKLFIIDIGGYTTDVLLLRNGQPDMQTCYSLELGTIKLYNDVINQVNAQFDLLLDEGHIDDILINGATDYPEEVIAIVQNCARTYAASIVNQLRELECDLRLDRSRFCGGGSILLKPYLLETKKLLKAEFSTTINENAAGFEWGIYQQSANDSH